MPRRTDEYRGMASESRLRVLDAILDSPGIALAELSDATDLHVNTLRDHVKVLEAQGLIVGGVEHRARRGRPRTVYHPVVSAQMSSVARHRIDAARAHGDLLRRLGPSDVPAHLDESAQHQVDVLYEHLDDAGLEPDVEQEADGDDVTLELVPCPFHSLVDANQALACGVHAKVIRMVLGQAGGPLELRELEPFTTPHACTVHLGIRRAPTTDSSAPADPLP